MRLADLGSYRVGVWGAGLEGQAAMRAIRSRFPDKTIAILNDSPLPQAIEGTGLNQYTGAYLAKGLAACDVVVLSPGVSIYRPEIREARARGVQFTSGVQLWFEEAPRENVIAITGTKGKTTTAGLVAHLLRAAGKAPVLAGNVGQPLLDCLEVSPTPDAWVLELSSYQVAGAEVRADMAVVLNLYPEHLDWHGSEEQYYRDKLNIVRHASPSRRVLNAQDVRLMAMVDGSGAAALFNTGDALHVRDGGLYDGGLHLVGAAEVGLHGAHNLSNVCAALTCMKLMGVEPQSVVHALATFRPASHRLEIVGEVDGVLFVDDSISTIPESAIAALEAFKDRPRTILLGGHDRGIDYAKLAAYLAAADCTAITMPDNGPRIAEALRNGGVDVTESESLEEAVRLARECTPRGGVILLSPAAPSYGRFKNYEARGQRFRELCGL